MRTGVLPRLSGVLASLCLQDGYGDAKMLRVDLESGNVADAGNEAWE